MRLGMMAEDADSPTSGFTILDRYRKGGNITLPYFQNIAQTDETSAPLEPISTAKPQTKSLVIDMPLIMPLATPTDAITQIRNEPQSATQNRPPLLKPLLVAGAIVLGAIILSKD